MDFLSNRRVGGVSLPSIHARNGIHSSGTNLSHMNNNNNISGGIHPHQQSHANNSSLGGINTSQSLISQVSPNLRRSQGSTRISHSYNHNTSMNQSTNLSLALKSKSPSCKTIFGHVLTKKKMPISMLSVTKYKDLLSIADNDPAQPDISIHIPIDNEETQRFVKSLSQPKMAKNRPKKITAVAAVAAAPTPAGNPAAGAIAGGVNGAPPSSETTQPTDPTSVFNNTHSENYDGYTASSHNNNNNNNNNTNHSVFIPFKNGKEINRHEFIKLHQEHPSFMNLDFQDLYYSSSVSKTQAIAATSAAEKQQQQQQKAQQAKQQQNAVADSDSDEEIAMAKFKINGGYRHNHKPSGGSLTSVSVLTTTSLPRLPNKIELSLIHNRDIQSTMASNLLHESKITYDEISEKIRKQQAIVENMPKIRQYPIFKKKQLAQQQQNASTGEKDANGNPIPDSNQSANGTNNNNNNGTTKATGVNGANPNQTTDAATATATATAAGVGDNQQLAVQNTAEEERKVRFQSLASVGDAIYQLYWYSFEQNHWKPDIRELSSLVTILEGKKAYLFGGVGNELYNKVIELDLATFKWNQFKPESVSGNIPLPRFGHSCNVYKKNLVFFGGEIRSLQNPKLKDCVIEVYFFSLEAKTWKAIPCTGGPPQPRKSHVAALLGRNLLVHGGINNKESVLKDMWLLDLGTMSWSECHIQSELDASLHACVPVYHSQRCGKITPYKLNELKITKWGASISQEGVYFFGGKNSKGDILGDLRVLRTEYKPMQWYRPETRGIAPKPRYGHTMEFSQELNFLIIHGGKNDNEPEVFFNDIHLLNVDDFTWIKVSLSGKKALPRSNHSSCLCESKLIVFGGINLDGYLAPFVNVLELDNEISSKMHARDASVAGPQLNHRMSQIMRMPDLVSSKVQDMIDQNTTYQQRLQEMENEFDDQKQQVNQLNFQNFKSFLPVPRFAPQAYSRSQTRANTFLKQNLTQNMISNFAKQSNQPPSSPKRVEFDMAE